MFMLLVLFIPMLTIYRIFCYLSIESKWNYSCLCNLFCYRTRPLLDFLVVLDPNSNQRVTGTHRLTVTAASNSDLSVWASRIIIKVKRIFSIITVISSHETMSVTVTKANRYSEGSKTHIMVTARPLLGRSNPESIVGFGLYLSRKLLSWDSWILLL